MLLFHSLLQSVEGGELFSSGSILGGGSRCSSILALV